MGGINHQKWVVYYCYTNSNYIYAVQLPVQSRTARNLPRYLGDEMAGSIPRTISGALPSAWGMSDVTKLGTNKQSTVVSHASKNMTYWGLLVPPVEEKWREHVRCWGIHFFTWWLILACARNHLHHPQTVAMYGIGFTPSFPLSPQLQLGLLAHEFARCRVNPSDWSYETT